MAKVKLSALVSEMRGKLNGSVFSKNRGGAYLRTKVTPVNPATPFQVAVRAALSTISQTWRTLTDAQRLAWNSQVSAWAKTDIFGDIKNPSGINLFNRLNLNLFNAGQALITDVPLPASTGIVSGLSGTAVSATGVITITSADDTTTAAETVIIEATPAYSPGISFVKNKYRVIDAVPGGSAAPYVITAAYAAKFGTFEAGQKISVRFKSVDNASGTSGQYTSVDVIAS